jgi:endonuclease/exonuclease/phosphatase (EEP) superfamily protein YafD
MPRHALNPNNIQVVSWNIAKGRHPHWQDDLIKLTHSADLALIQEARLEHSMHQAMDDSCWAFAPGYRRHNHTTGVMTISRAETIQHSQHSHREPLTRLPKAALITEYRLQQHAHTLLVANVHAINFTPGTGHFSRQLHSVVHALAHHQGPLIVCGDFNTWRGKRLRILSELIAHLGLEAIVFEQDHRRHSFGFALDHIFYRGLKPRQGHVQRVHSSDHNPISAVLGV